MSLFRLVGKDNVDLILIQISSEVTASGKNVIKNFMVNLATLLYVSKL